MSVETPVVEEGVNPAQSPLVTVTFQRDANRKLKYLEAEPKALGITQIGLSAFQVNLVGLFMVKGMMPVYPEIPFFICSLMVVIAGSVAVAAQNLHVPTLKACLGMQIVASVASIFNLMLSTEIVSYMHYMCWHDLDSASLQSRKTCLNLEKTTIHIFAEFVVVHAALVAISITLAVYCCKVVNCCGPPTRMPVITLQAPPVQQQAQQVDQ
ncbi:uncharacterized protein V6R79_008253 [Siganus canaliculatus]